MRRVTCDRCGTGIAPQVPPVVIIGQGMRKIEVDLCDHCTSAVFREMTVLVASWESGDHWRPPEDDVRPKE